MNNVDKKVTEAFEAGCHLGHKNNRVHPKARKYIYSVENGVSVIDLTQTIDALEKVKKYIVAQTKEGKTMLVVATKKIASSIVAEICRINNIPSVTLKWPAGLLTNFDTITKNVKKLEKMKADRETGEWNKYVKHEQVKIQKEINKLERFYGGIVSLKKLPDFLFVIDIKKEKNSVTEAKDIGIPVVAITDTNVNPDEIDFPIPGNDDSLSSIEYFIKEIVGIYSNEKSKVQGSKSKTAKI